MKQQNFEKIIKVKFNDNQLLEQSLTHKSANKNYNNEKLEFLGDRVIGLILSKKLFDLYPNENEGSMDKKFAKLVNRKTCSKIGWLIELQNYILVGGSKKTIKKSDEKILSDACEALIGAIYIDQGYIVVEKFVLKLWKNELLNSNITVLDPKTELQEYSLKLNKELPIYKFLSSKGPNHNPIFKISVKIKNTKEYYGVGKSKQDAEQDCAKNLLKNLKIK